MKEERMFVKTNRSIGKDIYEMVLCGDTSAIARPGQFVNIQLEGLYLRRPISVCDCESGRLTLVYRTVGVGTQQMAALQSGERLNILPGLGNGFHLEKSGQRPLLVGGGIGVPPLYWLCKVLMTQKKEPIVVLGFNCADEIFYEEKFRALGVKIHLLTTDGSRGQKGRVTDVLSALSYTYFYTCGPMPMYRAMRSIVTTAGEYSFEERMGCGFGACMGCSCKTKNGAKRICRDGPVLESEEIVWDD